jgi:hypothetical protein
MTLAFMAGATCLGSAVAALFFARFWRDTGDRLFILFAAAFAIFAVNRLLLTVIDTEGDGQTAIYLLRAAAFAMIALAIVDKNRPGRRGGTPGPPQAREAAPNGSRPGSARHLDVHAARRRGRADLGDGRPTSCRRRCRGPAARWWPSRRWARSRRRL